MSNSFSEVKQRSCHLWDRWTFLTANNVSTNFLYSVSVMLLQCCSAAVLLGLKVSTVQPGTGGTAVQSGTSGATRRCGRLFSTAYKSPYRHKIKIINGLVVQNQ